MLPRLPDFRSQYPDVEIELVSSVRHVDFEGGPIDAAIRFGDGDWSGLCCDPLMTEERLPVCSPALAAGPAPLQSVFDLARCVLLHNGAHPGEWAQWFADAGVEGIAADRGPVLDASYEMLVAAADGRGVASGRRPLVEIDLKGGRLVALFDASVRSVGLYCLVAPEATAE